MLKIVQKIAEKKQHIIFALTVLVGLVTLFVLYVSHKQVPFMMDDNWYATKLFSEEPIRNLKDIYEAQVWHFYNWGGRSMAHALLQMILLMGSAVADILNVVVTVLLGVVMCKLSGRRDLLSLVAAVGMLFGLNADWFQSMYWQSGAANYLYITVFILLFVHCYFREIEKEEHKLWGICAWIIPLGILAGWSNENMGPVAWILATVAMVLVKKSGRKLDAWMWVGNISCLLGSVLVIVAPGNFVRSKAAALEGYGTLWKLFLRCYVECKASFDYLSVALVVTALVLVVGKAVGCKVGTNNVLYLLGALLSWGAMILSPHYPARATFGTMILLAVVVLSMAGKIMDKRKDLEVPMAGVLLLIWLRGMFFVGEYLGSVWGWIK